MAAPRLRWIAALVLVGAGAASAIGGEAIITNQLADSLSFVDTLTMKETASLAVSGKPAGIALSPDRRFAYVTAPDGREVLEIDVASRTLTRRLGVGGGPLGIAAHPTRPEIYVADWYEHTVSVVDLTAWKIAARIAVGQSPSGLAVTPDGRLLLSADRDSNMVSVIDVATRVRLGTIGVGERPFGLTIDAEGRRAYTANVASNDVTVIDIAARKAVATVKVGRRPYAVALAAGRGFVTDQYSGTVSIFDTDSLAPVATIDACDHPEGIEADGAGNAVFVACWGDNIVMRLDPRTLAVTGKAKVGDGPRAFGRFLR